MPGRASELQSSVAMGESGGAPCGTRFWCTFSPVTPDENRCIMQGRSRSAHDAIADRQVVAEPG